MQDNEKSESTVEKPAVYETAMSALIERFVVELRVPDPEEAAQLTGLEKNQAEALRSMLVSRLLEVTQRITPGLLVVARAIDRPILDLRAPPSVRSQLRPETRDRPESGPTAPRRHGHNLSLF